MAILEDLQEQEGAIALVKMLGLNSLKVEVLKSTLVQLNKVKKTSQSNSKNRFMMLIREQLWFTMMEIMKHFRFLTTPCT